jgi:hypothetical protein
MPLIGTDTGLRLALDPHRKQVAALEAEMERRVNEVKSSAGIGAALKTKGSWRAWSVSPFRPSF